ncbi:hypothetical protein C9374_006429 [Naegleria lovaniensis]|uniref:Pseudouridine synthase RsuA/RluA-like domain-containing protein n=1 Tax=Naegleria lovaniensis TaxID=51637 RepID=A0AA88KJD8_NAELO|nr:uncharacterized protein C9374_006429 [Naegleria lovaniensis]KAG2381440.1 hypothetical protein C9374_006429 [Naegleria lovaniensis]
MLQNVFLKGKFCPSEFICTNQGTIRHAIPFYRKFDTRTKSRLLGKPFVEGFCTEYVMPQDVFVGFCENEFLKLNRKKVTDMYHIMKRDDTFQTDEIRTDKPINYFDSLEIIHEDDDLLVVSKPENVPVHSTSRYLKNNLIHILKKEYSRYHPTMLPEEDLYPLHRLDRRTSGVLLLGKKKSVAGEFSSMLRSHQVGKQYLALVNGICNYDPHEVFKVDFPIMAVDPLHGVFRAIHSEESKEYVRAHYNDGDKPLDWNDAKHAETLFQVLHKDYKNNRTILLCQPITGRTHQIRVHLIAIGHGIVGEHSENYNKDEWIDMAHQSWKWKLEKLIKHGFGSKALIEEAINEKIHNATFQKPPSLGLFSIRYRYKNQIFECSIYRPEWMQDYSYSDIYYNMKHSELYTMMDNPSLANNMEND